MAVLSRQVSPLNPAAADIINEAHDHVLRPVGTCKIRQDARERTARHHRDKSLKPFELQSPLIFCMNLFNQSNCANGRDLDTETAET
jgi:hypothetical protein